MADRQELERQAETRRTNDGDFDPQVDTTDAADRERATKSAHRELQQQATVADRPVPVGDPRAIVLAERAAGRGDSAPAIAALRQLGGGIDGALACVALARIESALVLGQVQSPMHFHYWAAQLRGLDPASRAREGYERVLAAEGTRKTFDGCIAELLELKDESTSIETSLAVIRTYRAAGVGADVRVVDEIVGLSKRVGLSFSAIERMLGGVSAESDDDLLERLERSDPVAFSAYMQARGRLEPRPATPKRVVKQPVAPDARTQQATTSKVSGGSEAGGTMGPYVLAAANFEGVADEDLNARMAEVLLRAAGAEPALAAWLAKYAGAVPPAKLYGLSPDLPDTYQQFRIFDGKELMTGAAIRAYLDAHGYIDPTINAEFWKTHVAPLLCNENVVAASQAELIASQYDKQIAELQKLIGDRATSPYIAEVQALQKNAAAYRELARKLQNKETSYAEQRKLMEDDLRAIDRMARDARAELAAADAEVAKEPPTDLVGDYQDWQRNHPGVPYRPPVQSTASTAKASLTSELASLEEQRRVTELVLATPGMVMPGAGVASLKRPEDSMQAPQRTPAEQEADKTVQEIESITTSDPFERDGFAKTNNQALIALMHLKGRVDQAVAGVTRIAGNLAGLVMPDSMTGPIYALATQLRETSVAFSNAQSAVTSEGAYVKGMANKLGQTIPVLDRVFTVQTLIEAPDQVIFTIAGVVAPPGAQLAIQGGIVGFQTLERFLAVYGAGGTMTQALEAAGYTAVQGAVMTLISSLKLPVAVAGNLAAIYMFGKLGGLSNAQIEEQIVLMLVTVGATAGATSVARAPRMTGLRTSSTEALEAMRNVDGKTADGNEPAVRRDGDPAQDAKIDEAGEQYRRALEELGETNAKLTAARKANDRAAVAELTKQLGVISERAKLGRESVQTLMQARPEATVMNAEPTKHAPAIKDGLQIDETGTPLDSPNGWYLDALGHEVNAKGQRVDADGRVLRLGAQGDPIPGQYLDFDGRPVDVDWKLIDDAGKRLTDPQIEERYPVSDGFTDAKLANGTPIELTGSDLNLGSGGTSNIYEGTVGGAPIVVKTPKGKPDVGIAEQELAAARRLEGLGGPKVLGMATFKRGGLEYTGVVLERVPGIDLARVLDGAPLPFAVTEQHLRALEAFRDATSAQKLKLFDVNPGDLMLTEDGRIVPLDIAYETRARQTKNPELDRAIERLQGWLGGKGVKIEGETPAIHGVEDPATTNVPPPELADLVASGIARTGEAWGNNINEGSCAHVAMRNAISAKLAGREAYILNVTGLSDVGQMLTRFKLDPSGRIAKVLARLGYPSIGAHAIAAVRGSDGVWRYLSWGRVELDWATYTKEVWGPTGQIQQVFEPDAYVKWMFDNPKQHSEPRGTSPLLKEVQREQAEREAAARAERAELGWTTELP